MIKTIHNRSWYCCPLRRELGVGMSDSKRKTLNKDHPDCAEYPAKFRALWDAYMKLEETEKAKYPDWRSQDHPANEILCPVYRKMCADIKALQKEYAHLFTEEE